MPEFDLIWLRIGPRRLIPDGPEVPAPTPETSHARLERRNSDTCRDLSSCSDRLCNRVIREVCELDVLLSVLPRLYLDEELEVLQRCRRLMLGLERVVQVFD